MINDVTRRGFLGTGLAGAGLALSSAHADQVAGANQRLSVGLVGPGGRARRLLQTFHEVRKENNAELTAICDIWSRNRERGAAQVKQLGGNAPRTFSRLEDMLAWNGLDAVIIATPDHAHAQHLAMCVRAGKHVYCEKPFANVLDEANSTIDICRRSDRVVTLGTQRRSDPHYLAAQDLMATKPIGDIAQVAMIQNIHAPFRWRNAADVKAIRAQDTDWRTFLMGRPMRPFDPHQYVEFRLFRDFSSGIIDQWLTHMIDASNMLTGGTIPRSATAYGGTYVWKDQRENGDTVSVALDFPQGFLVTYNSTLASDFGSGCRILGRQGTLEFDKTWRVSGEGIRASTVKARAIEPKPGLQGNMDQIHMRNWLECARAGRKQTHCTADHGYQHAIACIMATRALNTGRRVTFDERTRTIQDG